MKKFLAGLKVNGNTIPWALIIFLFTLIGGYCVLQFRVEANAKTAEAAVCKSVENDKRLVKVETSLINIDKNIDELKADQKEILKYIGQLAREKRSR